MEKLYKKLPFDLSGSRTKNRFRNEILWGLEKIFAWYLIMYVIWNYIWNQL